MAGGEARVNYRSIDVLIKNPSYNEPGGPVREARTNYRSLDVIVENHPLVPLEGSGASASASSASALTIESIYPPVPDADNIPPQRRGVVCTFHVHVVNRGGHGLVDILPFSRLTFSRRVDEVSTATITIPSGMPFTAQAWRHEIVVIDDHGVVRWAGPVTNFDDGDNEDSSINARDLSTWFDRRLISVDRTFTNDDLAHIYGRLAADALVLDPSPNINIATQPCGVVGDRSYEAAKRDITGDKLRELTRTGVDYTCLGRQLLIGGAVTSTRVWTLTGDMCAKVRRQRRGLLLANDVGVVGATITDDESATTVIGRSRDESSVHGLGLIQARFNESEILDESSAKQSARSHRELMSDDMGDLRVSLKEGEYSWDDLVPGCEVQCNIPAERFPERTRRETPRMRLATVDCTFSPGGIETEILLQPLGTSEDS